MIEGSVGLQSGDTDPFAVIILVSLSVKPLCGSLERDHWFL